MLVAILLLLRSFALICSGHCTVALENLALRQQLAMFKRTNRRPAILRRDRVFWVLLSRVWEDWRAAVTVVRPETVVRWHRQWLRRRWARRSAPTRVGRPSTSTAIRTLVAQMHAANPLWGAPRIHGELRKLGVEISERTISRLVPRRRRPPSQTWRTFLANHLTSMVSMDFFTVPTLTGRVLFVLVLMSHHRRHIVHFRITEHPTAAWTAQQLIEAFPEDAAPLWLLRPSMATCSNVESPAWASVKSVTAPSSPWQNPYVERVIGSIRRKCLNHVIIFNETHLRRTLAGYLAYYHHSRTHLSLGKDAPTSRPVQAVTDAPTHRRGKTEIVTGVVDVRFRTAAL